MVKVVLFGSLSTLTNLIDLERRALNLALEQHGVPISWSSMDYMKVIKQRGRFSGVSQVIDAIPNLEQASFYEDLERHFRNLIDDTRLVPHPWTEAALLELAKRPTKVALVSGAERQTVLRVLAAIYPTRASTVFNFVTSQGDVAEPKPSPALYLHTLKRLNVSAINAMAIEATQHGMMAAQRAGLSTAGFQNRYADAERLSQADFELGKDLRTTIDRFHATRLKSATAS